MKWSIFKLNIKLLNDNQLIFTTFAAINNHKDQIQSISWRDNGQVFVTSCKDKRLRIIDPRTSSVVQVYYTNGYQYYITLRIYCTRKGCYDTCTSVFGLSNQSGTNVICQHTRSWETRVSGFTPQGPIFLNFQSMFLQTKVSRLKKKIMNPTALNIHVQKSILKPNQDFHLLLLCF